MLKRKIIVLGLIAMFTFTVFVSCTSETNNTKSDKVNQEEKIIKVGTSGEYYPWCFKKDDKLQGFEVDVWNEISKRSGYKVEYSVAKFSGLIGMLDSDQIDTVAHQISVTKERLEKYDFTETYAYSGYSLVVKNESSFKELKDFKGKKVGCVLGGNGEKTIRELNDKNKLDLEIVTYDGTPMEKDVELGRIDAAWYGSIKAKTTIEKEKLNLKLMESNHVFEINKYPFLKLDKKPSNKEKIEDVNKAIKSMREDETLKNLSLKWFNEDITIENKTK
ncbi:MAG: transporter substrate-binding domain-containing protein [Clostridium sp.]